ncbi:MAG: ATP-binding protein [Acidimicrobiia bacterium]
MQVDIAVCLPRDAETVTLLRGMVANALSAFGVTRECVDDIRLALSEACTNVIQHAAADDEYEVRLEIDERCCAISVANTGHGFDAAALAGVMPDVGSPRGRGVAIMRALMDWVDFSTEPETGTIVRLVKVLSFDPEALLARLRGRHANAIGAATAPGPV